MKKIIKKINKVAFLGLACIVLTGCNDFLDIIPKDMVTEDNFWDEKTDVEQMVFGCYEAMQSDAFISRAIAWGEMRSDNLYNGTKIQDDGSLYEIMRENLLSTNAYTSWTPVYAVINRCNQIIAKAPEVAQKDPTYTSSEVQATIAEMTAIRSLCYFYLIRAFEDVPYYTNAVKQEDQVEYLPTTSFNKVLDNLIADLESVRNNAYKVYPNEEYNTGRITQDAIHAM
ncbi:MAG: RagB/SusD family nutrient uptake outer membrane protein, partial [Paraprevotella sp.]|nr:RagB/SusD family nutrient uptake outer membrane protein [Paraprevotella sp.]